MNRPLTVANKLIGSARPLVCAAMAVVLVGCASTPRLPDGRRLWSAKVAPGLAGGNLLVIFMPDEWPAQMPADEQESYAAWAAMVEEFVRGSTVVKEVRRADFRSADEVFYGRGLPVNEYTLLFIRGDGLALYAHDPILDGAIYDYAEAFLAGKENEQSWTSRLHSGESEANMPRALKVARLAPMTTDPVQLKPHPGPLVPAPAPAAPAAPAVP